MVLALLAAVALTAPHHHPRPAGHAPTPHAVPAPARAAPAPEAEAESDAGAAAVDAGAPGYTAVAEPTNPKLGEPFAYTVDVSHPKDEVVSLPKGTDLGDFDLVSSTKQDLPAGGDQVETTLRLVLRGWALGSKTIPDLHLEVQKPQGIGEFVVHGPTVELTGALDPDGGAEEALREIAPPVMVHVRTYRALAILGGILLALLAGYGLMRYLKRERPVVLAPPPPPIPAHVRARQALEALLAEDLPGKGRQREFYFQLSEVVRRYLGERFGFDGLDLTTEELLAALRTRPTPGLDFTAFKTFCDEADLAKFAKFQPSTGACKTSIDAALYLVQTTTAAARSGEVES